MQRVLPLTDRVRAALTEPRTSAQIEAVMEEIKHDLERIRTDMLAARSKAVDPMTADDEATAAREAHHNLTFEEERATSSSARLKLRLGEVLEAEERERGRLAYEAAAKEREECIVLIRDEYPKHADAIVDILKRIRACDAQLEAANKQRPDGQPWLHGPDYAVREADGIRFGQLVVHVILPGEHRDAPYKWARGEPNLQR